jgi:2-C-methyl-D-erythritol 2,4-cyclodiphosphate synthase
MRIGSGHDTHRLEAGRSLILAGVRIEHPKGLAGHSDGDVVLHAVTDALLGAAGLGDIGEMFPDTDPQWRDADSSVFVTAAAKQLHERGWRIANIDVTIFAQEPKLTAHKPVMKANLARLLTLDPESVNIKAKTGERVGHIGRGEAIDCHAVVLIEKR